MTISLERLARNQVLFREVNERVREMLDEGAGMTEFLCECSFPDCTENVALEVSEYERIRSQPNQFVVLPGHEVLDVERVVWESDRYFLVEKTVEDEYAVKSDPRTRPE